MNAISLALTALIILMIIAAVAHLINNRRKGRSDCGCNCGGCSQCAGSNVELPECCSKEQKQ